MSSPTANKGITAIRRKLGEDWNQTFASTRANGNKVFVFQRSTCWKDIAIVRNDIMLTGARSIAIPEFGAMICHSIEEDPALRSLQKIIPRYHSVNVLRYRPGKRATLAGFEKSGQAVIIKCLARGALPTFRQLQAVYRQRSSLSFRVSRPLALYVDDQVLIQTRLAGEPLRWSHKTENARQASRMAEAIISMHKSPVMIEHKFDVSDQQMRSARCAALILERLPSESALVNSLMNQLQRIQQSIARENHPLVPIHGSLHSHQWLIHGDTLALVDFDRAAMGHPELDFATFLTEWDYEDDDVGMPIKQAFMQAVTHADDMVLAYYRSHKHLAKAYKASKIIDPEKALVKCRRNLSRARALILDWAG